MKRRAAVAFLLLAGCSTNPVANVWDWACPARGVCSRSNASPAGAAGVPADPGCAKALQENQNYRKGLLERFRRSSYPPNGVPPASAVPAANP